MVSLVEDLPINDQAKEILRRSGIKKLYPPQRAAFEAGALDGRNLVLASPTASGKTLVAEVCALRHVTELDGKVLYLTPLRALAKEKYDVFLKYSSVKKRTGDTIRIGISTGDYDSSSPWLGRNDVIITSVDHEEPTIIREDGVTKTVKIGRFIDDLMRTDSDKVRRESDTEVLDVSDLDLEAVAFDSENLKLAFRKISKIIRHKASVPLYRLRLETGREVTVTGSHSVYVLKGLNVVTKRASEIEVGDLVLIPKRLPLDPFKETEIDLTKELNGVREAGNIFIKNLPVEFFESSSFKNLEATGYDKKDWKRRRELPLAIAIKLGFDEKLDGANAFFSYIGSRHKVPIKIPINQELLRLIGYYIAEGSMDGDNYRVSFALNSEEKRYVEDICKCTGRLFHFKPSVDERRNVTYIDICDKVAYLLFSKVLNLPRGAKRKKVPHMVFNVRQKLQREFLKSLIRGDGFFGPRIDYTTSSRLLASDLLYLLLQNSVIGGLSYGERRGKSPSGKGVYAKRFDAHISAWSELNHIKLYPRLEKPSRHQYSHRVSMIPTGHIKGILEALCRKSSDGSPVHFGNRTSKKKLEEWLASGEKKAKLKFLRLLLKRGSLTSGHVSEALGIPWSTVNYRLKSLLRRGLVERKGSTGHYVYHISSKGSHLLKEIRLARKLFNSHFSFARVKEINRVKPSGNYVYDISVPGCENFVAGFGGVICHNTNEKCDSLLRHRAPWIDEITLVIADEVHLLTSADRGPTLEVTLARLRQVNPSAQILALSATIRNADEVAGWLQAKPITVEWRPVKLLEGVYLHSDKEIIFRDGSAKTIEGLEKSPSINVALDTVRKGRQALIFAGTRRRAISVARKAGSAVEDFLSEGEKKRLHKIADSILKGREKTKLSELLSGLVSRGVAFHHAGLAYSDRRIVEDAFRDGKIRLLVATPTLAAGVNLPARTVVIADYRRYTPGYGAYPISVLEYKQMVGRAGRPQYDDVGESVMIARTEDEQDLLMEEFICSEPEQLWSKLAVESVLRSHVLSTIATGFAHSESGLMKFLGSTFYAYQYGLSNVTEVVEEILDFLCEEEMLRRRGRRLLATRFGRRVSELYIDPMSAVIIRDGLRHGAEEITDFSFLHLVCRTPDLSRKPFPSTKERDAMKVYVGEHVDEFMLEMPERVEDVLGQPDFAREIKAAMVLEGWINELPEAEILDRFHVEPGDLYYLTQSANWIVYAVHEIARLFGYKDMLSRLSVLGDRVRYGVREEVVSLARLKGIGRVRARMLFNSGFSSIKDLKRAPVERLSSVPLIGTRLAVSIKEQVGGLVGEEKWKELKKREVEQREISEYV
ncbi:MAG: DEAD/DEAH box helicase [Candidatus Bathyarchaeia archaeon]